MAKIIQHIPSFVSGVEPEVLEFKDEEELESTSMIQNVMGLPSFQEFRQHINYSDVPGREHLLIAYLKDKSYYVIGYLDTQLKYPDICQLIDEE